MVRRFSNSWRSLWQASRTVILTSAIVAVGTIGVRHLGLFQPLELNFYDRMIGLRPSEAPDARLLVVGITEEDVRRWQYPVPNKTILELLQRLEESEPRAIGLDVIRDAAVQGQPGEREALLQFMQESGVLVAVCRVPDRRGGASGQGFPPPEGLQPEQFGAVNLGVDPDNVVRRAFLTVTPPSSSATAPTGASKPPPPSPCNDSTQTIPYFGLQLALNYLDAEKIQIETTPEQFIKLGDAVFKPLEENTGPYRSPDVGGKQGYQLLINYRTNSQIAEQVTLTDVLEGKVGRDRIKDRVVLIGYVAESVKDDFATPFNQQRNLPPMPGVVIHAHTVSQILSSVLDNRPQFWFWQPQLEGGWILAWSIAGALLAWRLRQPFRLLGAIALATGGLIGISYWVFTQAGWIPVAPPLLAFLLAAGIVIIFTRGVAQAIYAGVKGFLKLDIEIDQEKKARDVAEITESSYFQELQARSEELRRQKEIPESAKPADPLPDAPLPPQAEQPMIDPTLPFKKRQERLADLETAKPQAQTPPQPQQPLEPSPPTSSSLPTAEVPPPGPLAAVVIPYRPDLDAVTPRSEPVPHLNIDVDLIKLFESDDSLLIPEIVDRPVEPPPAAQSPPQVPQLDLPEIAPPPSHAPRADLPKISNPPTLPAQAIADLEDLLQPAPSAQPTAPISSQRAMADDPVERSAIADLENLFRPSASPNHSNAQPAETQPPVKTQPVVAKPIVAKPAVVKSATVLPPSPPASVAWAEPPVAVPPTLTNPNVAESPMPQSAHTTLDQLFQEISDYHQQLKQP